MGDGDLDAKRKQLTKLWGMDLSVREISVRMGLGSQTIHKLAKQFGLPPKDTLRVQTAKGRAAYRRVVDDIWRRTAIAQPDPIIRTPSTTPLGMPIKSIEPATRALIDAALGAR